MPFQITGERLTSLFRPRSVALVGASDKSTFSMLAYRNLVEFGFGAHTHLVSRRGAQTHGRPTVTSCAQIGEPVDVAYLMVPQAGMLDALDDAAAAGIRNACVLSSGYAEAGEAGRAAQAALAAHAASLGMVLLGPNHLGFANFTDGVPVCSIPGLPRQGGPVALLSQSGASSSAMLDFATMVNVGLSYLVTLGNEAMITADLGVIRVDTIEDMLITAGAAAALGRLERPGIGIVSISGGACNIVADRADDLGAALPELAPSTRDAIGAGMQAAPGPTVYINQVMQPVTDFTRASMARGQVPYVIPGLRQAVVALRNVAIASADILHKSDIGGVRLDVAPDEDAVRAAYRAVTEAAASTGTGARVEGVLISPMRRGGTELLVGVVRDPQWGPVLAVAIGGLLVEVLQDSALAPLPVTPGQAGRLLDRLRGRAVLNGVRGGAPADRGP